MSGSGWDGCGRVSALVPQERQVIFVTEGDKNYSCAYHADGQRASADYGDQSASFAWDAHLP